MGLIVILPFTASAIPMTGSRTTPESSGVKAGDGWQDISGGFRIAWSINDYSSTQGYWEYTYTLTNNDSPFFTTLDPGLSHWILELSDTFTSNNIWDITGGKFEIKTFSSGGSNPDMLSDIYGIKFEPGDSVTFKSDRSPMWGDFYAKDGKHDGIWATAWNTGFGQDPYAPGITDYTPWIAVPDTTGPTPTIIPEPSTLILLLIGLLGLTSLCIRRKR